MASDAQLAEISPDSVVLISGPPMTGKYELMFQLVSRFADGAILISTKNGATRLLDDFEEAVGSPPAGRVGIIDCVTGNQRSPSAVPEDVLVEYVSGPADLTTIGVKFTELSKAFQDEPDGGQVCVGLHSISQLVMHSDLDKVYKFLQVLTGQIRTSGWAGVAVVDKPAVGGEEASMLEHHFDELVQTRENDTGRREFRIRGRGGTTDWEAF